MNEVVRAKQLWGLGAVPRRWSQVGEVTACGQDNINFNNRRRGTINL